MGSVQCSNRYLVGRASFLKKENSAWGLKDGKEFIWKYIINKGSSMCKERMEHKVYVCEGYALGSRAKPREHFGLDLWTHFLSQLWAGGRVTQLRWSESSLYQAP